MNGSSFVLDIRSSRFWAAAVAVIHFSACGAVVLADLSGVWSAALLAIIVASYAVSRGGGKGSRMRCQADAGLAEWIDDEWLLAELLPEAIVWPWLVVLRYRLDGSDKPIAKIVLPDSLSSDDFRRLRVWLRWRTPSQFALRHDA